MLVFICHCYHYRHDDVAPSLLLLYTAVAAAAAAAAALLLLPRHYTILKMLPLHKMLIDK